MKKIKLLYLIPVAALIYSCEPEFKDEIVFEPGEADFRTYVAIGNSLTAGFQGNALSREGQINSYPSILAEQFAKVEDGMATFKQPLLDPGPGIGPQGNAQLILGYPKDCTGKVSLGPVPAAPTGQIDQFSDPGTYVASQWPFHNFGVPGAKVNDVVKNGYTSPFWVRFADQDPLAAGRSILNSALAVNPTFYSVWIGNNDILGFATSGGSAGNITPYSEFLTDLEMIINDFSSNGAEGVIANIPDITSIPFFTTVPWNGLTLNETQAAGLNAGFGTYNAGLDAAVGNSQLTAEEAERRKIRFTAGANAFVIVDNDMTDLSGGGLPNWRQITSNELLRLNIPMDSVRCFGFGSVDLTTNPPTPRPITEQYVLDTDEISMIKDAIRSYNEGIKNLANLYGLALVDTYTLIKEFESGVSYDGIDYSTEFVTGGLFSLDGVHPNSRGYAIIANAHIDAINAKFNANVPKVNVNDYEGLTFPN